MSGFPHKAPDIEAWLDQCLEVEFSFLKTASVAARLEGLTPSHRNFILDWAARVASTNIQLAWRFIQAILPRIGSIDFAAAEDWALSAMARYDQYGLHQALAAIEELPLFLDQAEARRHGVLLQDHQGVLMHFLQGLSGREMDLKQDQHLWTDTGSIYLPPVVAFANDPAENFQACKCMLAFAWAAVRFGQFRAIDDILSLDEQRRRRFLALESVRLGACLERELPGLYRRYDELRRGLDQLPADPAWHDYTSKLRAETASVADSLALVQNWPAALTVPVADFCQGQLHAEQAARVMAGRMDRESRELRRILRRILTEQEQKTGADARRQFSSPDGKQGTRDNTDSSDISIQLELDGRPVPLPQDTVRLLQSIVIDHGRIPPQYLEAAGDGSYDSDDSPDDEPDDVWQGTYHERGAFLYDEWDYRRRHYRKDWCAVREISLDPRYDGFAAQVLNRYSGLVRHLHRSFEALREEDRVLKRQAEGEGVDVDAMVEALADSLDGREMSERLYTRLQRSERNTAVCFMIDMSGSTRGWVNTAEREALVLLAEALETLGDRYAIYGFSGMARKRCEIYAIKTFDEAYTDEVRGRISAIEAKDYTRMGFAIRHLSMRLNEVDARTRLLICISDGKPDDYDSYRGQYGIEDTRRALIEARYSGIHPYCITIDRDAGEYLSYMYGPAAYTVIDEVHKLPLKVSDIYRRLSC